jgi:hypothetical protein
MMRKPDHTGKTHRPCPAPPPCTARRLEMARQSKGQQRSELVLRDSPCAGVVMARGGNAGRRRTRCGI